LPQFPINGKIRGKICPTRKDIPKLMTEISRKPWSRETGDLLGSFQVDPVSGLSGPEAARRREKYGPNRIREGKTRGRWEILLDQFKSVIMALLGAAAVLSFAFGDLIEGIAILAAIVINAGLGFLTEVRAVHSMEALRKLSRPKTRVRRDGQAEEIPTAEVVPGEIVVLESGDIVPADLRILEANRLEADESALTGESVPVEKNTEPLPRETEPVERSNMLFKGTAVTGGSGVGLAVAVGMETELGRISKMARRAAGEELTPLEKRLNLLGRKLIWVVLAIVALVAGVGIAAGRGVLLMIQTAVALAVAAVPEGLPIVATIALARGMWRMARRNALVNRLSAVETLGSTTVICVDKTGTLTENRMKLTAASLPGGEVAIAETEESGGPGFSRGGSSFDPAGDPELEPFLQAGVLCSNAEAGGDGEEEEFLGDPTEVALVEAGRDAGIEREGLLEKYPEVREAAFDPEVKMMATFHRDNGGFLVAVKGAPEAVLEACDRIRKDGEDRPLEEEELSRWRKRQREMAEQGLRVLALARKEVTSKDDDPYRDLILLGLAGLHDPPRKEVKPAIERCRQAGVRTVMITGDQALTARRVGEALGLIEEDEEVIEGKEIREVQRLSPKERRRFLKAPIFARVSPARKLDLIALHQEDGQVVAMTGDGINDAPALEKADIGVAMGRRGEEAAKQSADMVLRDDSFATIGAAIELGRGIFENIRKFTLYLLSGNVGEIVAVAAAAVFGLPLPLLPLQILYLNIVNDVFPALALGVGEGPEGLMERPPRDPKAPILDRRHWTWIGLYGFLIAAGALGAFTTAYFYRDFPAGRATTVSFLTVAFARLWHVFNLRSAGSRLLANEIVRNRAVWGSLALCSGLLAAAVYLPGLSRALKVSNPGLRGWLLVLGSSLVPLLFGQLTGTILPRTDRQ
jgi:P-type Ca2+ transporter type 2C